jgi:hypothetical protein
LTSFLAVANYSPLLVLVTGLSTFAGLWAAGRILQFCVRLQIPSPWTHVTAILLGIQVLSFLVQTVSMANVASRPVLSAIWWSLAALGAVTVVTQVRVRLGVALPKSNQWALLPIVIVGTAVAANLLIAIAPSTKIDELYYHMLLPSRIVTDGALRFYREPWEGAILPDMLFQISSAPAHAIGYPDAANVVSWGISITLLWFAWQGIRAQGKPVAWCAVFVGGLCVGMYPAVFQVTGGAHAMGDLAMAAALIAFCTRESLLTSLSPPAYAAMLSIMLLSAVTAKITALPLCVIILCFGILPLLWVSGPRVCRNILGAAIIPWIVLFFPITLWTWVHSGSPFGPVLSGVFASPNFVNNWSADIRFAREVNQVPLLVVLPDVLLKYSPLVWLGVIGAIFFSSLPKLTRATLCLFLVLQCSLIYWLLPYDPRFLGGLHFGLLIVFAAFATPPILKRFSSVRYILLSSVLLLLPWLAIQAYYAQQFFPVSLGLEKRPFYERYVAFYNDYILLNQLLSNDTVILVRDFRLSAVYAPRPVFFDPADLPKGKPVVLFAPPESLPEVSLGNYTPGKLIYSDSRAVIETYRTPGPQPIIGPLEVRQLVRGATKQRILSDP